MGTSWTVIEHSECGASHIRSGLPNQDAIAHRSGGDGVQAVLAVSDGHGSERSFRSDVGSRLAVKQAVQTAWEFAEDMRESSVSTVKNTAEQRLPGAIVRGWRQAVREHYAENPFPENRPSPRNEVEIYAAYGATLLLVIVAESHVIYLQLGDGDILAVSDKTGAVEMPITADPSLMANETTSLCLDQAHNLFRFGFQFVQEVPPAMILVSTDGYSNSFASDADFQKVGTDVLRIVREQGLEYVRNELAGWLKQASQDGSGDDVTLGIICRRDLATPTGSAERDSDAPGRVGQTNESEGVENHE